MNKEKAEIILNRYNKKIFNYLLKMLSNREDAEDVFQEVFISFFSKIDTINEAAFQSYLFRIAHNKALNLIKKRKSQEVSTDNIEIVSDIVQDKEEKSDKENIKNKIVKNALQQLSPREASAINLQFYEKFSYKQIANVMDTSVSAVDSLIVRAKRKLKKIISQES